MGLSFEGTEFIIGSASLFEDMQFLQAYKTFDIRTLDFLSALSTKLLSNRESKNFPDVITFAFWCRKSNITTLSKAYENIPRLGRGVAFHIAPSNVPVNFAYSLAAGMLAGNANIVRVPSKDFPQVHIICDAIKGLLPQFAQISERICFVRYSHNKNITDVFSSVCMSRIIWGGDDTIREIRTSPIQSRANEITFSDRFSICVINADKYLTEYDKAKTAKNFFNDTYLTDQNACTSPRIIFWMGTRREEAKTTFWGALDLRGYELQAVQAINKLTRFYEYASYNECKLIKTDSNKLLRVHTTVNEAILEHLDNSGYFYECDIDELDEIIPVCTRKMQTLSYLGMNAEEIKDFSIKNAPNGIDRIVPVGKTMDFSLVWDGIDLIQALSRRVNY